MKAQQSRTQYGPDHWWAKGLSRAKGPVYPTNTREGATSTDETVSWARDKQMTIAKLHHTDSWPLTQPWVIRAIAHWCQQHCRGKWFIGELDHLYFEKEDDALSFQLTHARPY